MDFDNELWFGGITEVTFVPSTDIPDEKVITAVKVFDIVDGQILLVEVPEKEGWDIPGGHVEDNEDPITATQREIEEETNGKVERLRMFGYMVFKKVIDSEATRQYPDESIIVMYTGNVSNVTEQDEDLKFEATKTGRFELSEVAELAPFWTDLSQQILDYAATTTS